MIPGFSPGTRCHVMDPIQRSRPKNQQPKIETPSSDLPPPLSLPYLTAQQDHRRQGRDRRVRQQQGVPPQRRLRRGQRPLRRQRRRHLPRGLPQRPRREGDQQVRHPRHLRLLLRAPPGRRHAGHHHRPVNVGYDRACERSALGMGGLVGLPLYMETSAGAF